MVNSLLVGEVLYNKLSQDEALKSYVGDKIYPILVKDENIKFPFVVFFRNTLHSSLDKTGMYEDALNYSVVIVSNKYDEGIYIANEVRRILEFKKYVTDKLTMYDSVLTATDEGFLEDSYVQTLTFDCKIH